MPAKSYEYNRRASEAARAADEPEVAAHHLERVLLDLAALPGNRRKEQAEVAEALGDLYYALGHFADADRRFTEALERLGTESPRVRARLLLARGEVARESLELDTAVERGLEAQRIFEDAADRSEARKPIGCSDGSPSSGGRTGTLSKSACRRSRSSRTWTSPGSRAAWRSTSGTRSPCWAPRSGTSRSNGSSGPRTGCSGWGTGSSSRGRTTNLGVSVGETSPQDGLEYLEKAQQAGERAHDARATGRALISSVELLIALGQIEEAERDNEQVGRLFERLTDELGREQVELNRGLIAERRAQWEDAERSFEKALEMCRRYQLPADEAEAAFYLARLRYKTRDLEGARRAYAIASDLGLVELRPHLSGPFFDLAHQLGLPPPPGSPSNGSSPAAKADPGDGRGL